MMHSRRSLIVCIYIILLSSPLLSAAIFGSQSTAPRVDVTERYDLRQLINFSFKSPFYLVRGSLPFWDFGGDTVVTDDYLRVTPAEKSRTGWIVAQRGFPYDQFVIETTFKIGGGGNLGADGMAYWYTKTPVKTSGPTFGGPETWQGLAITLDTFDNDRSGNHPYIAMHYNDGTWRFEPGADGGGKELGGCKFSYRNYETKMKFTYADGIAQIEFMIPSLGQTDWTYCTSASLQLPSGYYFGVTAATGGLFDNHDVMNFVSNRLVPKNSGYNPPEEPVVTQAPPQPVQPQPVQQSPPPQPVQQSPPPQQQQQPPQQQQPIPPQQEPPAQPQVSTDLPNPGSPATGIPNRVEAISNKLKTLLHEFQDKEQDNEPIEKRSEPPEKRYETPEKRFEPPTRMGTDTQAAVSELLKEIQSLREQQADISYSVASLQTAVGSYVSASNKVTEDLGHIKLTQQSLNDAIDRLMNKAATKEDLKSTSPAVSASVVADISRQLNELKTFVQDKVKENNDLVTKQVQSITAQLNDVKSKLESARGQQQALESQLRVNNQQVTKQIEESGSWGFWIYFFLFQVLFGVSFMWWKRLRDNEKKLL